jgi:mannonate dehydratase
MKIGLGLYRQMLTGDNFQFAQQAGATHIVAHLVDYFALERRPPSSAGEAGWGSAGSGLWGESELVGLRKNVESYGLKLAAIENFDPGVWYDILLDGPKRAVQIENVKTIIRRVGAAGIPVIGYNFSLANVWGHVAGPWARGGAETVAFRGDPPLEETLIPNGEVWNMRYSASVLPGTVGEVLEEEVWRRLREFLLEVVPVAEEAGVRLAMHPADPPVPVLRGTGRLVYHPDGFQRLLDLVPSPSNAIEFCQGTVSEMPDSDVYEAIDRYSASGRIAYVHFRNIIGKAPDYHEVFIDEGDVDMAKAAAIYLKNGFDGVAIPDHTPKMTCAASWHAGMAYALGYMRATVRALGGTLEP